MKKKLSIFILALLLLLSVFGCGNDNILSDIPYSYPILPGTAEWDAMSPHARRESCYVDRNTAEGLSTSALLITVLDYPFFGDIDAFNDPKAKLLEFAESFPPLIVLCEREDAVEVVEEYISEVEKYDETGTLNLNWYNSRTILQLLEIKGDNIISE